MSAAKKPGVVATAEVARLVASLQHSREQERSRLSRMLHHDVSGMLAAARMDLSRLVARTVEEGGLPEPLLRVDQLLEQVIDHVRDEMQRLHPALIDHFGLAVALRQLIEEKCRGSARRFAVEFADEAEGLAPPLPIAVFRMVETLLDDDGLQEFAAALRPRRDEYVLELTLAPVQADPDRRRTDDLRALRTWLEALGATWKESSRDGKWSIELRLPRRPAAVPSQPLEGVRTVVAAPGECP